MRTIFFILLLCPIGANAQLLELSIGGGISNNTKAPQRPYWPDKYTKATNGYAAALQVNIPVFKSLRVGVQASAYKMGYSVKVAKTDANAQFVRYAENRVSYGNPAITLEAIITNRFKLPKISLDVGIVGGVCITNKYYNTFDVTSVNVLKSAVQANRPWYTYGAFVSGSFAVSKSMFIGADIQPKFLYDGDANFFIPTTIKFGVRI